MQEKRNGFGIDAFWLKLIAMLFMVIDHVHTYILIQMDGPFPVFLQYPGRIVSPIFFYFLVEGFFHTRSRLKYGMRLLGWSAVMAAGSWLLVSMFPSPIGLHNNIFLSLFFGLILVVGLHMIEQGGGKFVCLGLLIAVGAAAVSILFTEASIYGVLCVLVFYYARKKKWILSIAYMAGVLLVSIVGLGGFQLSYEQLFLFDPQWMMIFALPFILLYNGKRGYSAKWSKYLFYVFYPVHLWMIYMIGYFIAN
ncbi:TraX family protein [Paenibacillus sp. 1001270B_150601_E10]|uniref:TraX family protein n=1 Tax=Paenibacillus sp. 1001270B_150601_E10 TaxID=2787079 RepID=UPI0018A11E7F|nr:TraX family protein [Paenibacillus sp. 1001270B_150601_E10]